MVKKMTNNDFKIQKMQNRKIILNFLQHMS